MAGFFDELVRNPYMARGIYHGLLSGQGAYTQQPPPELLQALATGQVQTQAPRTGLGGALAGMGIMSPNYQVNPQSQLIQMLMLREQKRQDMMDKLQLFEQMAKISSMIGGQRAAPMFSGMVQDPQVLQAISGIPSIPEERLAGEQAKRQQQQEQFQQRQQQQEERFGFQKAMGEQRMAISQMMAGLAQQKVEIMQERLSQATDKKQRDMLGDQMLVQILRDPQVPDWQKNTLRKVYMQTRDSGKAFDAMLAAQPPPEEPSVVSKAWQWMTGGGEKPAIPAGRGTINAAPEGPAMPPVPSAVGTPEPAPPKEDW